MKEIKLTVTDEVYERLVRIALADESDIEKAAYKELYSSVFKYKTEKRFQEYLDEVAYTHDFIRSLIG